MPKKRSPWEVVGIVVIVILAIFGLYLLGTGKMAAGPECWKHFQKVCKP